MRSMQPVSLETAKELIDFSGGKKELASLAQLQIEGAVALQNMIANPEVGLAYLADEVGMGKTYMALGVVALMRFFNPSMRVLYIAPKNNVREKWVNDYKSFITINYRILDGINKGVDGKPAVPFRECHSVIDLLQAATAGQTGDYFICGSAFSFALDDDSAKLQERLRQLVKIVPAIGAHLDESGVIASNGSLKESVKEEYAKTLNYALPLFDLVVVDECHNFKNGLASSDRNRMLARILGAWNEGEAIYQNRVRNALLLSATPFDRNLQHIKNQLELFGKQELMASATAENYESIISRFLVRRLNALELETKDHKSGNYARVRHTRNMYRTEHRSGPIAEIRLRSDEQKLFTALVQKKVGDALDRDYGGKFQTGMLASFESYLPSTTFKTAEFDGEQDEKNTQEAPDKNVIEQLVSSFRENFNQMPPHPKMDEVSRLTHRETFVGAGKKQLIFVRRVKSVPDLKAKLDESYDNWIHEYLKKHLQKSHSLPILEEVWQKYELIARKADRQIWEGNAVPDSEGDDNQPPQNDNFFTWFFRGATHSEAEHLFKNANIATPEDFRKQLTQKSSPWSIMFEINWKLALDSYIKKEFGHNITVQLPPVTGNQSKAEPWRDFIACQIAYLTAVSEGADPQAANVADLVLYEAFGVDLESLRRPTADLSQEKIGEYLNQETFFSLLCESDQKDLAGKIFPVLFQIPRLFEDRLSADDKRALLRDIEVHRELLATLVRIDHVFIDLYIARITESSRDQTVAKVLHSFVRHLDVQRADRFSSKRILADLARHFTLILKLNFSDIADQSRKELRRYIVKQISPLAPIIGASGETSSNRSSQARKFRMPGYPLILVSTDVFQEGEDLHTFCDRVTHYGVSSSPISLEQKVGRVDRVHSLAQRNLLACQRSVRKHFIRVFYPHIKETVEYQQMFTVAHNLNAFIESLHKVGASDLRMCEIQDANHVVLEKIPGQISTQLVSPFAAEPYRDVSLSQLAMVRSTIDATENRVQHVRQLVHDLDEKYKIPGIAYLIGDDRKHRGNVEVRLRSARTSGSLILSASAPVCGDEGLLRSGADGGNILKAVQGLEADPSFRLFAREEEQGGYRLVKNVDMLVDAPEYLQKEEVENLLDRVMATGTLPAVHYGSTCCVEDIFLDAKKWLKANTDRFPVTSFFFDGDTSQVNCQFFYSGQNRMQTVQAGIANGYLILTSGIATSERILSVAKSDPEALLRMTILRNANIDFVELHFTLSGDLAGRICHPIAYLQPVEFVTYLHTLATECDQMEYLLDSTDTF